MNVTGCHIQDVSSICKYKFNIKLSVAYIKLIYLSEVCRMNCNVSVITSLADTACNISFY